MLFHGLQTVKVLVRHTTSASACLCHRLQEADNLRPLEREVVEARAAKLRKATVGGAERPELLVSTRDIGNRREKATVLEKIIEPLADSPHAIPSTKNQVRNVVLLHQPISQNSGDLIQHRNRAAKGELLAKDDG